MIIVNQSFKFFFLRLGRSPQAKWVIGPVSQVGPVIYGDFLSHGGTPKSSEIRQISTETYGFWGSPHLQDTLKKLRS